MIKTRQDNFVCLIGQLIQITGYKNSLKGNVIRRILFL